MNNCGICDNRNTVNILTTRIFDNVRIELNRSQLLLETNLVQSDITPLYAGGTGVSENGIPITPHLNENYADLTGNLNLKCTFTYLYQGNRQSAQATLKVPVNLRMSIPEDSVWPFNVTVHYSFFSDNLKEESVNTYSSLTDGVIIVYVTSCMPLSVSGTYPILYNSEKDRIITSENTIASSAFYPTV